MTYFNLKKLFKTYCFIIAASILGSCQGLYVMLHQNEDPLEVTTSISTNLSQCQVCLIPVHGDGSTTEDSSTLTCVKGLEEILKKHGIFAETINLNCREGNKSCTLPFEKQRRLMIKEIKDKITNPNLPIYIISTSQGGLLAATFCKANEENKEDPLNIAGAVIANAPLGGLPFLKQKDENHWKTLDAMAKGLEPILTKLESFKELESSRKEESFLRITGWEKAKQELQDILKAIDQSLYPGMKAMCIGSDETDLAKQYLCGETYKTPILIIPSSVSNPSKYLYSNDCPLNPEDCEKFNKFVHCVVTKSEDGASNMSIPTTSQNPKLGDENIVYRNTVQVMDIECDSPHNKCFMMFPNLPFYAKDDTGILSNPKTHESVSKFIFEIHKKRQTR